MKRIFAILMISWGSFQLCWIFYNVFINTLPEARGHNPIEPTILGMTLVLFGMKLLSAKRPLKEEKDISIIDKNQTIENGRK